MIIDKLAWICLKDRKVLFVRAYNSDKFLTPGGKRDQGETDEQALFREIKEELGVDLDLSTLKYANVFKDQAYGKPEGVMVEIKCYWGDYLGDLKPSSEIEELAWFTSADVPRTSNTGKMFLDWLKQNDYID